MNMRERAEREFNAVLDRYQADPITFPKVKEWAKNKAPLLCVGYAGTACACPLSNCIKDLYQVPDIISVQVTLCSRENSLRAKVAFDHSYITGARSFFIEDTDLYDLVEWIDMENGSLTMVRAQFIQEFQTSDEQQGIHYCIP